MVQSVVSHQVPERPGKPRLWVGGSENKTLHASEHHRARAHRAWLEGDVESASVQSPVAGPRCGLAQRQDLGVGGWVTQPLTLIAHRGQDLPASSDQGPDRHVAPSEALPRLIQGRCHEFVVGRQFEETLDDSKQERSTR